MKITRKGFFWGDFWLKPEYRNKGYYPFYFMWFLMGKEMRDHLNKHDIPTFGLYKFWYDHPHAQLNLHFFGFGWSSPWTTFPEDDT